MSPRYDDRATGAGREPRCPDRRPRPGSDDKGGEPVTDDRSDRAASSLRALPVPDVWPLAVDLMEQASRECAVLSLFRDGPEQTAEMLRAVSRTDVVFDPSMPPAEQLIICAAKDVVSDGRVPTVEEVDAQLALNMPGRPDRPDLREYLDARLADRDGNYPSGELIDWLVVQAKMAAARANVGTVHSDFRIGGRALGVEPDAVRNVLLVARHVIDGKRFALQSTSAKIDAKLALHDLPDPVVTVLGAAATAGAVGTRQRTVAVVSALITALYAKPAARAVRRIWGAHRESHEMAKRAETSARLAEAARRDLNATLRPATPGARVGDRGR